MSAHGPRCFVKGLGYMGCATNPSLHPRQKTFITVNRRVIDSNRKHGRNEPAIRVAEGRSGKPRYARTVKIDGPSRVVYSPAKPLGCGARLWIETEAKVVLR